MQPCGSQSQADWGDLDAMSCAGWQSTPCACSTSGASGRLSPGRSPGHRRVARGTTRHRRGRHLGGIDRSVAADDAATMQVNAMGTWNLFEASLQMGVRRVIHCSSSSVLGLDHSNPKMPPCYLPIDEAHPLRPTDAYGLSKACGERIAEAFSRRGLEVIIIRPCFVAFPDMADFMAGKPGPEGRSEPMPYLRTFVGPEDCARGCAAAATADYAGCETFFLAAAKHLRTNRRSSG